MEEQKYPSRSERHKKKKAGLFQQESKEPQTESPSTTQKSGREWYFSDIPEMPTAEDFELSEMHINEINYESNVDESHLNQTKLDETKTEATEATDRAMAAASATAQEHGRVAGDSGGTEEPTHTARKRKKRRNLNPAIGFLLLFVMLCSGAWCGYAAMNAILPPVDNWSGSLDQEMLDNINILVLGCDEREGDSAARADVIMLATIRPDAKKVSVFSIPRDTRVDIKGHSKDKINHAMAYGGIPLIQDTVETLLDVKIDHYVKVNFDGFINVIDALGGVNIDVPCRMYKPLEAIDLQEGYQTLDGSEALAFVRWRGDGTGDYGRIERQQEFLTALTGKVKDMNLKQALNVASAVMDSIETDMSIKQMTSYGVNLLGIGSEDIKTYSFIGEAVWLHGVNYVEPDMAAINEIVDKMQHGEPEPVIDQTMAEDGAAGADDTQQDIDAGTTAN